MTVDWRELATSLVVVFGIPLRDAWTWTLLEYKAAFKIHIDREAAKGGKHAPARFSRPKNIRSADDVQDLEAHLKKMGAIK